MMKEKVKQILRAELIRPETALMFSFLTPVVLYLIMFAVRGVWPLGNSTIFGSDLYHQYGPFFSEFRYKLINRESLFYTWNMGLGMNFWALIAYYLASPLNLLSVLVSQKYLVEFMTILIVIKIGLCGLSMTWYLRRHCQSHDFGVTFFGILYAMSGYVTAYHWNLMWMDGIILFPMILWGLERLVKKEDGWYYCVFLAWSIWSNYYISIMTCMFLVLYFPVCLFLEERQTPDRVCKIVLQFVSYSLLAGGLAAVLLAPEWQAIQTSYAGKFYIPDLSSSYFSIFSVLARHLANVRAVYEDKEPNVYCGVVVLFLVPLYLSCRQIRLKERLIYASMALLFLTAFCIEGLDYIWHGFHFPNCFPARESYLYIFLLLFMSYRVYMRLSDISVRQVMLAGLAALAWIALAQMFSDERYFRPRSFVMSTLYILVYVFCALAYGKWERLRHLILILIFATVALETLFTVSDNGMFDNSRSDYTCHDEAGEEMLGELCKGKEFFRAKVTPQDKANEGTWMHYPAMNAFSSTNYDSVQMVLYRFGCESQKNYYSNNGATPLVDMLFGISFDLSLEEKPETVWRTLRADQSGMQIYEQRQVLPLGFQSGPEIAEAMAAVKDTQKDPALLQNRIAQLLGCHPVLIRNGKVLQTDEGLQLETGSSGEYYLWVAPADIHMLSMSFPDKTKQYRTLTPGCLLELGECGEQTVITVIADEPIEDLQAKLYRFDGSELNVLRNRLVKSEWKITEWTATQLSGTIFCREEGMMLTTIPYDAGWSVWVDGRRKESEIVLDAFLGVPLTAGEHDIQMSYTPPGFQCGAVISACSLILFIGVTIEKQRRKYKYQNEYIN